MHRDLGDVLVRQAERVELEGGAALALVGFDHGATAAGVAGDGVDRDRMVVRDDAVGDQRPQERDRTGRIAAGIADALGFRDARGLAAVELGEAVDPFRIGAKRRAGVEQLGRAALVALDRGDQVHRGARGVVGEAEHHQVDAPHDLPPRGGIAAQGRVDAAHRDGQLGEPAGDAEAGGAGLAIDEDAAGQRRFTAWRTGTNDVPWRGRTSCAPPRGCRG